MKPSMLPDYHIHTYLCRHAQGQPIEYYQHAQTRNIPQICFTDHMPSPHDYDPAHRMEMAQFETYRAMVSELQGNAMPDVLFGIEADYYDGCESYLSRWLPDQGFDFVLGSVHFVKELGYDRTGQMRMWNPEDVDETWQAYFRWVGQLALSGLFDAVAHIDLPKKFGRRASEKKIIEAAQLALDRVADAGMGLEINTSGLATKAAEIYPSPLILSMALERRIPVCFGSDSHHPQNVGRDFDKALRLARQVGYSHYFQIRKRMKKLVPLPITLAEL